MPVAIALLRGINVGGHAVLPMEQLRALCGQAGLADARTYIQSGNVVFRCEAKRLAGAAKRLGDAIEAVRGFRPVVVVRTMAEFVQAIEAAPFAPGTKFEPNKSLVMFLADDPAKGAEKSLAGVKRGGEELRLIGNELHLYFPDGVGKSKLSLNAVERAIGVAGTARNWNTIQKVRAMAEELAAS